MGERHIGKTYPPTLMTVRQTLQEGTSFLARKGVTSARLDAELLLGKVMGAGRESLYVDDEMPLQGSERRRFQRLVERRARREPVSYITGQWEFWSLEFLVTPAVLVPRPETELLVEIVLALMAQFDEGLPLKLLDLGTGSGVIAVSLAKEQRNGEIWATDLSGEALEIARANATHHGVERKIHFLQGDLFEPVKEYRRFFQMVISNPPYVRRGEMKHLPREIQDWEPKAAIDGGWDGLDLYRRIIQEGHRYLVDGGLMALEIGADMGSEVSRLFAATGCFSKCSMYKDYAGRDRVLVARKLA